MRKKISKLNLALLAYDVGILIILAIFNILSSKNVSDVQILPYFIAECVFIFLKVLLFFLFKNYTSLLKYMTSLQMLKTLSILFIFNIIGYFYFLLTNSGINTFAFILTAFSELFLISFGRLAKKVFFNYQTKLINKNTKIIPTLLIGAGSGCLMVIKELEENDKLYNKPVVIVDDDKNKQNKFFYDLKVAGTIADSIKIIEQYGIEEAIITIANLSHNRLQQIVNILTTVNIKIKRIPTLTEMIEEKKSSIADVRVEDLLERDVISLSNEAVFSMLTNQTVLVTGGGGSIGSELCRQIAQMSVKKLIIFDIYENNAYDIQMELLGDKIKYKNLNLEVLIGSTYNLERIEKVFKNNQINIVFHAAAYKHVPLMENSPEESIRTNVLGTYNVAQLAGKYKCKSMILVSTDKAVRPTNVMGATKRFAELIIQGMCNKYNETKYSAVRFGNVLGSNGSVVPLFEKQIANGGPITVTDKRVTRYFMTIKEAVSLILQSASYANGREIFILDMGHPVKIINLAEKMIRIAGLIPYKDINIVFTGLRPGEKIYEELLVDKSKNIKTANDKIYIEEIYSKDGIEDDIIFIEKALHLNDNLEIKKMLKKIIYTYMIDNQPH